MNNSVQFHEKPRTVSAGLRARRRAQATLSAVLRPPSFIRGASSHAARAFRLADAARPSHPPAQGAHVRPVSYTNLDVYKRQRLARVAIEGDAIVHDISFVRLKSSVFENDFKALFKGVGGEFEKLGR